MAEVMSFAIRSCSSYNMRVRRLPGRKFGLVHGHVVPIPTPDGKVTAISFGGHDPECSKEAKDALTFPAGSAVGRLLHVPRATLDGKVHITPREAACLLCAAEGKSDLDIAIMLGIPRSTVLKHLRRSATNSMPRTERMLSSRPCEDDIGQVVCWKRTRVEPLALKYT
jgi:hypothetical protein